MSKHTPGPWTLGSTRNQGRYISGEGWAELAHVVTVLSYGNGSLRKDHTGEANARLIAAAPELLAVLEALANTADNALEDAAGYRHALRMSITTARAAIAKARGEG